MRTGLTISTVLHALVLTWGLYNFAPRPLEAAPSDSLPVDIISSSEFSQMVAGTPDAPKAEKPRPLAEKVGEAKRPDSLAPKVVEKPEIIATASTPPAPEAKPEVKKEAEHKQPDPKPDPIAEALKKDEAKKPEPKKEEAKIPVPIKKPEAKPQPKFDPNRIAALLDKRDPQRQAAVGDTINHTPTLGTAKGNAPVLSQSEIDAFKRKVQQCWSPPVGAINASKLKVDITIRLRRDGTLEGLPELESGTADAAGRAMNESAMRALIQCQPYTMFSAAKYDDWKEIPMSFDPIEMFGG